MRKIIVLTVLLLAFASSAFAAGWTATATVADEASVSAAVALPSGTFKGPIRSLTVYVPTIDSATVGLQVSGDGGSTYADLRSLNNNTNIVYTSTAAGTGGYFVTFPGVDFSQFTHVKVKCGAAQTTAAVDFIIYGVGD